jgi:hypothetical protein
MYTVSLFETITIPEGRGENGREDEGRGGGGKKGNCPGSLRLVLMKLLLKQGWEAGGGTGWSL